MIDARTGMTQISDNNNLIAYPLSHIRIIGLINSDIDYEEWISNERCV